MTGYWVALWVLSFLFTIIFARMMFFDNFLETLQELTIGIIIYLTNDRITGDPTGQDESSLYKLCISLIAGIVFIFSLNLAYGYQLKTFYFNAATMLGF